MLRVERGLKPIGAPAGVEPATSSAVCSQVPTRDHPGNRSARSIELRRGDDLPDLTSNQVPRPKFSRFLSVSGLKKGLPPELNCPLNHQTNSAAHLSCQPIAFDCGHPAVSSPRKSVSLRSPRSRMSREIPYEPVRPHRSHSTTRRGGVKIDRITGAVARHSGSSQNLFQNAL